MPWGLPGFRDGWPFGVGRRGLELLPCDSLDFLWMFVENCWTQSAFFNGQEILRVLTVSDSCFFKKFTLLRLRFIF